MHIKPNTNFININNPIYLGHTSHDIKAIDKYGFHSYSITDLCISANGSEDIYIKGDLFIASSGKESGASKSTNYLHLMMDIFGQYLILKEIIPNLKMCVILEDEDSILGYEKVENFLKNNFNIGREDYVFMNKYKQITFENVYFADLVGGGHILNGLIDIPQVSINNGPDPSAYFIAATNLIRNNFNIYEKNTNTTNKKVFFSRLNQNRSIRFLSNLNNGNKYVDLNDVDLVEEISKKHNVQAYARNVWGRYISPGDEIFLEDFFKYVLDYDVIDAVDYSIDEQIEIAKNATHITGLAGAAFINTMFCKKNAKVIVLSLSDIKNYPFYIIPNSVGADYYSIPDSVEAQSDVAIRMTVDELIELIEQKKHLFI